MIVGGKDYIARARRIRKLFGGGMRQAGILAAAGLYAIENNINRLVEDHRNARILAEGLNQVRGLRVDLSRVETNIIIVDVSDTGMTPEQIVSVFRDHGVLSVPFGRTRIRLVTHLDVSEKDCLEALNIISSIKLI